MPIVWCAISAHGFGHAAQVIPILNELGNLVKSLRVILRTEVVPHIFEESLHVPWTLQPVAQDVGCCQPGPLEIDIDGTWAAYKEFHENWKSRMAQEVQDMRGVQPNLVISNISYLAIGSAVEVNCPVVAIASLSWDQVLQGLLSSLSPEQQTVLDHIQMEYSKVNHLIKLHPGIDMPAFSSHTEAGPSFPLLKSSSKDVRKSLKMKSEERLVLVAFGGVSLTSLPLEQMEACEGVHFLVAGMLGNLLSERVHRVEDVGLSFGEIMRQVDVVMSKPGYATITTVVHYGIPLIYVRRHNFVDEQPLVDYVHKHGRAQELSRKHFESGVWIEAIHRVMALPLPLDPLPKSGSLCVASVLRDYL